MNLKDYSEISLAAFIVIYFWIVTHGPKDVIFLVYDETPTFLLVPMIIVNFSTEE